MRKVFFAAGIIMFCTSYGAYAQPEIGMRQSVADSLRNTGDIKGAIAEFKKDYKKDPRNRRVVYNYACALSLDKQIDSSFKYLNIAVRIDTTYTALTDPDLVNIREDKQWIGFEKQLVTMLNLSNHESIKDIDYASVLWRLMAWDQSYMTESMIAARKLGPDSPVVSAIQKLKQFINEKNQKELEDIIAQKGWPKNSEVGTAAAGAAFYVIQHSNATLQAKYIEILKKRCDEKEANWTHYAMLYDRMKMNQNLPQRYGTQSVLNNSNSGAFELYKLEDRQKVNEWRKEVGLPPLLSF